MIQPNSLIHKREITTHIKDICRVVDCLASPISRWNHLQASTTGMCHLVPLNFAPRFLLCVCMYGGTYAHMEPIDTN